MIKDFYENDMVKEFYINDKNLLRVISFPKVDGNLKAYIKKFLNFKVFPYVNSAYGNLIDGCFDNLPTSNKFELLSILKYQMHGIEQNAHKQIMDTDVVKIEESLGIKFDDGITKDDIYSSIKGGEYGEMFLNYLFISLGYEKIMSKLYIEWGPLSPTGIDAPYIDIQNNILVLGESKIFKSLPSAITSVMKDLDAIYNGNKFDYEVSEWSKKFTMMPESVQQYFINNSIKTKEDLLSVIEKTFVVGMVMGDYNLDFEKKLKSIIDKIDDFDSKSNVKAILMVIPLNSKDMFIRYCIEEIDEMIFEFEEVI